MSSFIDFDPPEIHEFDESDMGRISPSLAVPNEGDARKAAIDKASSEK